MFILESTFKLSQNETTVTKLTIMMTNNSPYQNSINLKALIDFKPE